MNHNEKIEIFAIDISKDTLELKDSRALKSIPYTEKGLASLMNRIISAKKEILVICEATGGYEKPLLQELFKKKIKVALVNPRKVRAYAISEGITAKTDSIDAKVLYEFALNKKLRITKPPSAEEEKLTMLLDRRSQLSDDMAREKNRVQKADPSIVDSIKDHILYIKDNIEQIEGQIRLLIHENQQLKKRHELITSVVGLGDVCAWHILAYLKEITQVNRNELAALVGVAPFNRDSGKFKGKRTIKGGRHKLRNALYMGAQTASNHNEVIIPYVKKLKERGKTHKMALVAAMRKLIIHVQAILKKDEILLA